LGIPLKTKVHSIKYKVLATTRIWPGSSGLDLLVILSKIPYMSHLSR